MPTEKRCKAVAVSTKEQCGNAAYPNSPYCWAHNQMNPTYQGRYKDKEYEAFIEWYALPAIVKKIYNNPPDNNGISGRAKLEKVGYDINNPVFQQYVKITTQKEFAETFNISPDTLCAWKKRSDFNRRVRERMLKSNVLKYEKDIDYKFTQNVLEKADPYSVKVWKQLYAGYAEKLEHSGIPEQKNITNVVQILNKKDPRSGRKLGEIIRDIERVEIAGEED